MRVRARACFDSHHSDLFTTSVLYFGWAMHVEGKGHSPNLSVSERFPNRFSLILGEFFFL